MKTEEDDGKISISVQFEGASQMFRLKKNKSIGKVLNTFAEKIMKERGSLRFTFDGETIRGNEDETPMSLGMEEGDQIDCHLQQIGGERVCPP